MDGWLYEFLYRGVPQVGMSGAWHIILIDQYGKQTVLNITQAEAQGLMLPDIINEINTQTMREVESLRIENAQLRAAIEGATEEISRLAVEVASKATTQGEQHAE